MLFLVKYADYMQSVLTVLTSATQTSLVKAFSGSFLEEKPFKTGKDFNVTEKPVSDLQSLSKVLQRLESNSTQTIIRGSLTEGKTNPVPRNKETFTATSRQWCMIDIDSLAWDGDINDQQAMLSYAIEQLPMPSSNLLTIGIIFHPAWASNLVSGCIYGFGWKDPALMMK